MEDSKEVAQLVQLLLVNFPHQGIKDSNLQFVEVQNRSQELVDQMPTLTSAHLNPN
jgi:hypothetical protein